MNSERTTETPAVDSGSDVWKFTDEPMVDGYIFAKLRKDSSDAIPSVALGIDSELLAYAEFPAQGAIWARLTNRDVLTEVGMPCCCCEVSIQDSTRSNSMNANAVNPKVFHKFQKNC